MFDLIYLGILTEGIDDFDSTDDLYDAIGVILHEVAEEKSEDDIRFETIMCMPNDSIMIKNICFYCSDLCERFLCLMKPDAKSQRGLQKMLDAPVNLGQMAANLETVQQDLSSIWVINRDDNLV